MKIYSIYTITNLLSNKIYVGYTNNPRKRWNDHRTCKNTNKLYNAFKKYGIENFVFNIIYQSHDQEHTYKTMETFFILEYDSFKNGYNQTLGGEGLNGYTLTEEDKKKISIANKGRKHSEETCKKNSIAQMGKIVPEHVKEKISKTMKGRPSPLKGRKHSEEHKRKNSESQKGVSQPVIVCPHCNKEGGQSLMVRYHFDHCKSLIMLSTSTAQADPNLHY